jgi:hypothetical protein
MLPICLIQGVACHKRNPVRTRVTPLDSSGPVYRLGIVTYSGHIHVQQSVIDTCLTMDEVTRGKNSNLSHRSKPETFLLNSNQQYYWDYNQLVTQKCTTQVHNSAKSLPNLWENILYLTRSLIYPSIHIKCFWVDVRLHRQKFYHQQQCKIFILTYGCYRQKGNSIDLHLLLFIQIIMSLYRRLICYQAIIFSY